MRKSTTPFRILAWVCVLALLLAPALPPTGATPAILAEAVLLFGMPVTRSLPCSPRDTSAYDLARAAAVPARAPPRA